jgi:hypothetical protein
MYIKDYRQARIRIERASGDGSRMFEKRRKERIKLWKENFICAAVTVRLL